METNIIHNEDCLKGMRKLPDGSIDLIVTSPPYGDIRDYNDYNFDFEAISKEIYRIIKNGGVVVWVVNDQVINGSESGASFKQALYFKKIGFNLHDTMIYKKDMVTFPDNNRYHQNFEYMFVLSKGKPKTFNLIKDRKNKWANTKVTGTARQKNGEKTKKNCHGSKIKNYGVRFNVWEYSPGYMKTTKDKFAYDHPAMFPEKLAEDHIISWSNENDIVLDPFIGSGTTAKMALKNGRKFIGYELSKEYVDIAYKRLGKLNKKYYKKLPEDKKPAQLQFF